MTASLFWVASEHHTWQSPAVYAKGPGESSLMRWWVPRGPGVFPGDFHFGRYPLIH